MVELTLQNCPVESAGRNIPHKYYILRPRSAKSKVKGHLQLYVAYVNDGTEPPRCVLTNFFWHIKVRKSRKQFIVSSILPKNKQKITILSVFSLGNTQDGDFSLVFFGRFEDTIICFRDCLTFTSFEFSKEIFTKKYQLKVKSFGPKVSQYTIDFVFYWGCRLYV